MNKKKTIVFIISAFTIVMLLLPILTSACTTQPAEVITLKAIRPFPYDNALSVTYRALIERVNERMAGRLQIEDVGGKEVYPTFEQLEPVMQGVVDLVNTPAAYLLGNFPEGQANNQTFGATGPEKATGGLIIELDKIARKNIGVAIIGAPSHYTFHILTREPVNTLDDLRSMKLRVSPTYLPVMDGLGVPTVTMPAGEVYTALQQGVVDGLCWSNIGMVEFGWHELIKYRLYPPLWEFGDHLLYMNAEKLDSLPEDIKSDFLDIVAEVDRDAYNLMMSLGAEEAPILRQAGVKSVVLSDAEWRRVQELHWDGGNDVLRQLAPTNADRLIQICSQWYPPKEVYKVTWELE